MAFFFFFFFCTVWLVKSLTRKGASLSTDGTWVSGEQRSTPSSSLQVPTQCPSRLEYSSLSFHQVSISPGSFLFNALVCCAQSCSLNLGIPDYHWHWWSGASVDLGCSRMAPLCATGSEGFPAAEGRMFLFLGVLLQPLASASACSGFGV